MTIAKNIQNALKARKVTLVKNRFLDKQIFFVVMDSLIRSLYCDQIWEPKSQDNVVITPRLKMTYYFGTF